MAMMVLSFASVVLFCGFAHLFLKSWLQPIPALNNTGYSKTALRVQKTYKTLSLGIMTFVFLIGLVISFVQVYLEL